MNLEPDQTSVEVEFLGLACRDTGLTRVQLRLRANCRITHLWQELRRLYPASESLFEGSQLSSQYLVSLDGRDFCQDDNQLLTGIDAVIILSADAGG